MFEADERAEAEVEAAGAVLEERPREEDQDAKKLSLRSATRFRIEAVPLEEAVSRNGEKGGGLTGAACDPGARSPAQSRSNVSVLARRRRKRLGR